MLSIFMDQPLHCQETKNSFDRQWEQVRWKRKVMKITCSLSAASERKSSRKSSAKIIRVSVGHLGTLASAIYSEHTQLLTFFYRCFD